MSNIKNISIDWSRINKEYYHEAFDSVKQMSTSSYLFKTPMMQTIDWINSYINSEQNKRLTNSNELGDNNIFSIVGERGSGKSSFIGTLRDTLKKILF